MNTKKIAFTSTTYFRREFSLEDYLNNLRTLIQNDNDLFKTIQHTFIVNEYSEHNWKNQEKHTEQLKSLLPNITFIQKNKSQHGQANSLNILNEYLTPFDLQLHWEEGWVCQRPFLTEAIAIMDQYKIMQLGLSRDLMDHKELRKTRTEIKVENGQPGSSAFYTVTFEEQIPRQRLEHLCATSRPIIQAKRAEHFYHTTGWPLFSLRPSINNVKFHQKLPAFPTADELWPWRFELLYGTHWLLTGGTKGVLETPAASPADNKKSTHTDGGALKP